MSKVKITGNSSGTGVFTIAAPGTNNPRTITLPDSTGTLLDENSSLPAANLTGTVADARFPATLPAISGASLTNLPAASAVAFPATQVASADANTLDDYEEGTWTPVWEGASGSGQTYGVQVGSYTKIGRQVFFKCRMQLSGKGSVAGTTLISGLPFTSSSTSNSDSSVSMGYAAGMSITANASIGAYVILNDTDIHLRYWNTTAGTGNLDASQWGTSGQIMIGGHYYV